MEQLSWICEVGIPTPCGWGSSNHGDSGLLLDSIIKGISSGKSITFWLDAHHSGPDTEKLGDEISPLKRELNVILSRRRPGKDIILIDDIKHLKSFGYTFDSLCEHLWKINKNFEVSKVGKAVVALSKT